MCELLGIYSAREGIGGAALRNAASNPPLVWIKTGFTFANSALRLVKERLVLRSPFQPMNARVYPLSVLVVTSRAGEGAWCCKTSVCARWGSGRGGVTRRRTVLWSSGLNWQCGGGGGGGGRARMGTCGGVNDWSVCSLNWSERDWIKWEKFIWQKVLLYVEITPRLRLDYTCVKQLRVCVCVCVCEGPVRQATYCNEGSKAGRGTLIWTV